MNTRLIAGPYKPPRCRIGGKLFCQIRGDRRVVATSDSPIPWPIGDRLESAGKIGGDAPSYVVCGDLVRALKAESSVAIQEHFGLSKSTVGRLRAALEIDPFATEGHRQLLRALPAKNIGAEGAAKGGVGTAGIPKNRGEANGRSAKNRKTIK